MVEPVFSAELPTFEIRDGLVYYIMPNGRSEVRTIAQFRQVTRMAIKTLEDYDARQAEVIPLPRRRKKVA